MNNITKDPVLVILVTLNCKFCHQLFNVWDKIINEMLLIYPKLRFPTHTIESKKYKYPPIFVHQNKINNKLFPYDLNNYILWYPMVMLIPGDSWDKCIMNHTEKLSNIQIMNSKINNQGLLENVNIWDIYKEKNYSIWLKEALTKININNSSKSYEQIIKKINDIQPVRKIYTLTSR
jgi:hypothetical protein